MRWKLLVFLVGIAGPSWAQVHPLFGTGKPPVFREEETDRRFARSKVNRGLIQGTEDPNCVQVLGALLTVVGEIAPQLHKRDESFTVDPGLLQALNSQLTNPRFSGSAYMAAMVRRVLIDRKLPDEWLASAEVLNKKVQIIDLGKLRLLNDGVRPIDSFFFTLPALKERYDVEVTRANSVAAKTAAAEFRDNYLDRDVTWGGLTLVDVRAVKAPAPPPSPKKKGRAAKPEPTEAEEPETLIAELTWQPVPPKTNTLVLLAEKPPVPVRIVAKLAPKQYLALDKLPRGKRMMVKGRLWEMGAGANQFELREALLFEDRDWSRGVLLAEPQAVFACPLAINELTGTAPKQPGGFAH